jgi:hypothetical protein
VTAHETSNRPASQIIGRLEEEANRAKSSKNNKKGLQSNFFAFFAAFRPFLLPR